MAMTLPAAPIFGRERETRPLSPGAAIDPAALDRVIAAIDAKIGRQLDAILHHPAFQALERSWRGLSYLVEHTTFENVQIEILPCTKKELRAALGGESVSESALYAVVYKAGFAREGGAPYAAMLADFVFDPDSTGLLLRAAMLGEIAHVPFVAGASPRFFGVPSFRHLIPTRDIPLPRCPPPFAGLRMREEARYLGLVLPRFLLRAPHRATVGGVAYEEAADHHEARCWGSAVYAFGTRLADSFVRYGWCPNIVGPEGGGRVEGLPAIPPPGEGEASAISTEVAISEVYEQELSEAGFIPLTARPCEPGACFWSARSVSKPKRSGTSVGESEEERAAELNLRLSTELPYVFVASRIAHYLKVVYRDNVEAKLDRAQVETVLNDWVPLRVLLSREVVPPAVRRRQLLRRVTIMVSEVSAAWYAFDLRVRPAFKHMGAFFTLRVVGRLDKA
jgi:type VI secretion system protein ImpC